VDQVTWPVAELGPITRLRAVAAGMPNAGVGEVTVGVPYDEAWAWMMDFERTTPQFDTYVKRVRIRRRTERGVRMWVWAGRNPVPYHFDVTVEDGFCMMRATGRLFVVLMAAVPDPDDPARTRYAHAEAIPLPGLGWLRRRLQREVDSDLRRLRHRLGE
jgi:hypothetical protein